MIVLKAVREEEVPPIYVSCKRTLCTGISVTGVGEVGKEAYSSKKLHLGFCKQTRCCFVSTEHLCFLDLNPGFSYSLLGADPINRCLTKPS